MKNTTSTILTVLLISIGTFAQDCDKLPTDGLYSFTKMTKVDSFSKDLRTYYLSETFKSDMKSGKWGGSLSIPIEGVPFSIGANDSEQRFTELRTKLLSITELRLEENNVQVLLQSVPNINLYQAYVDCVEKSRQMGQSGFIQGTNIETEDNVVFTIYYRPSSPTDAMPVVRAFHIVPEGSILSGNLTIGDNLKGFTTLVTCKRPIDKDLILTLQTDRGAISSKASAQENITSSKELPIGTIVTSYLNFEQFNTATKNNDKSPGGIWTSTKSKWTPCDGRPVPNSKFQTLTSQNAIPDLRGMFLRGLNTFDPYQPVPVISADKADPENRIAGSYQNDTFKSHTHGYVASAKREVSGKGSKSEYAWDATGYTTAATGGDETRPKNVAVYYYLRIN
ncbi:MAG: hypothetical protein ABI426_12275 [Flavobacterium sp.]